MVKLFNKIIFMEAFQSNFLEKTKKIIIFWYELWKETFEALTGISSKSNEQVANILEKKFWKYFLFLLIEDRKKFFIKIYKSFYSTQIKNWENKENKIFSHFCKKLEIFSQNIDKKNPKSLADLEKEFENCEF